MWRGEQPNARTEKIRKFGNALSESGDLDNWFNIMLPSIKFLKPHFLLVL